MTGVTWEAALDRVGREGSSELISGVGGDHQGFIQNLGLGLL